MFMSVKSVCRWMNFLVRLVGVLIVILVVALVYLRAYGIPTPLLQRVLRTANDAGIPVYIGSIKPSLNGWRATDVHYNSLHPGDALPIFKADEVYFPRFPLSQLIAGKDWEFDIEVLAVEVNPSIAWGIEVPEDSQLRNIESAKLSLSFLSDRIELSDGMVHWLGAQFSVNGGIVKPTAETKAARLLQTPKHKKTESKVYVSEDDFQKWKNKLSEIQVGGDVTVDMTFHVDINDFSSSTFAIDAKAFELMIRGVGFSPAGFSAGFNYPNLQLEQASLNRIGDKIELAGNYDLSTGLLQGKLSNTITSSRLLEVLPDQVLSQLEDLDMHFGQLPKFDISIPSCNPFEALSAVYGSFSIEDFSYAGSTIKSLGGKILYKNERLLLNDLSGTMLSLESKAEEMGSGMLGGPASGSVYYDTRSRWFGVDADVHFDPSLLIGPLSSVRIATNVLHRFKFNDEQPPSGHLELGACVTNWSTFFIDVEMEGNEVMVHDAELSWIDVSASYSNKVLLLDPLEAKLGINNFSGMASIDFDDSTARFDMVTTVPPLTLQNAVYPQLELFGKRVSTTGMTSIKAKGKFDWVRLVASEMTADLWAEQIDLSIHGQTNSTATVRGDGSLITLKNTQLSFCDEDDQQITDDDFDADNKFNHLSGSFSIEECVYGESSFLDLSGLLMLNDKRLKVSKLMGTVSSQEEQGEKTGSRMLGGAVGGSVSYDAESYWLEVAADINFDPTLLIGPLSPVDVATNVLSRFKFNGENAPKGLFKLGTCVTNWNTFSMDVQLAGNDVRVHDADLSSVEISASYSNQVLVLDNIAVTQGTNDLSGSASIDVSKSLAQFDIKTSIPPLTLQNVIHPELGLFGATINTSGQTSIKAKGAVDWKFMEATDFSAEIYAEQVNLSPVSLTEFFGTLTGKGPMFSLTDSQFILFGGQGVGGLSVDMDPETHELPYTIDMNFKQLNVLEMVQLVSTNSDLKVSGKMAGAVRLKGDLEQDFFESARGEVSFAVTDSQLAHLPFLNGFTRVMRRVIPSFNMFLFTGFSADYQLADGVVSTDNAYLEGELISAKARGSYSAKDGFDATVQVQTFSSGPVSKVVRYATDPLLKLVEIKLTGTLKDPSWKLK